MSSAEFVDSPGFRLAPRLLPRLLPRLGHCVLQIVGAVIAAALTTALFKSPPAVAPFVMDARAPVPVATLDGQATEAPDLVIRPRRAANVETAAIASAAAPIRQGDAPTPPARPRGLSARGGGKTARTGDGARGATPASRATPISRPSLAKPAPDAARDIAFAPAPVGAATSSPFDFEGMRRIAGGVAEAFDAVVPTRETLMRPVVVAAALVSRPLTPAR